MDVVAVLGAVDARENGTADQGTRATRTMREQKPPRTWYKRTPVTRERGSARPLSPANSEFEKTNMTFQWLEVARQWLFERNVLWLGVARQWLFLK